MDKEMIIFAGVIVLMGLVFFSVDKWQKAEKKLKKAEKKLEEYKQANSPDSSSWTPIAKQTVLIYGFIAVPLDLRISSLFISTSYPTHDRGWKQAYLYLIWEVL